MLSANARTIASTSEPHHGPPTARRQPPVGEQQSQEDESAEGGNVQPVHRPGGDPPGGQRAVGDEQCVVGVAGHHRRQLPAEALDQQQPADRIARDAGRDDGPDDAETQEGDAEEDVVVEPRDRWVADDIEPPADDRKGCRHAQEGPGHRPRRHKRILLPPACTGNGQLDAGARRARRCPAPPGSTRSASAVPVARGSRPV